MIRRLTYVLLIGLFLGFSFIYPSIGGAKDNTKIPIPALPIEVLNATMYRDGGTFAIHIKDSQGKKMLFCKDNRMVSGDGGIYYGAWHPSNKGAVKVNPNDKVIDILLSGLRDWLKGNKAKDEEDRLKAKYVSMFIADVERYRGKIKRRGGRPVTKKEAIEIAEKAAGFLVRNYEKVRVEDNGNRYRVVFVGVPFEDKGKKYEFDFEVVVTKDTGDVMTMASIRYYEVK